MLIREKIDKNELLHYFIVFFTCCVIKCVRLFGIFNMRFVSDNFGILIMPSLLAGRDWSGVIPSVAYYGCGYYILFTPLFSLTKNPYVIYYTICFVNICVLGLTGMLVYRILIKYFHYENILFSLFLSVLCSEYVIIQPSNFTNETPAFLAVWLIVLFIIKCYLSRSDLKKQFKYTIYLVSAD